MKGKLSSCAGVIIPILIGAGLTLYIYNSFSDQQLAQMMRYFVTANYNYVYLSLFIAFLGYVLRAYRWKYTLAEIGSYPGFRINFLAVSVGYFVNLGIPRSGEVSRALILKNYKEVPFDKAFGTIIAERIVDFFILLGLIITAVILQFSTLKEFLLLYISVNLLIVLTVIGVIGMLISFYIYQYSKWKYILLLKSKVEGIKEGALSVWNMPKKWPFFFYTLLIWSSYILMFYTSIFSLKETSSISLGTIIVAFVVGGLVMTFSNGGFGLFPPLIAQILVLYHVPQEAGIALGWIIWTSQFIITFALGVFGFLALSFTSKIK